MNLEIVDVSTLKPDPNNARGHEEGVPELAASLEAFGQQKNIVVWHDTVIAGNGLLEAAKSLGWKKIAISRVPTKWTYRQAQAFALADNKTAELSSWKLPELETIRFDLEGKGWNLEAFGFDPLPTLVDFGDADPDDVPDIPEAPTSKVGDLYQLGDHRLLCGDSTDEKSVARLMGGGMADLVFTDPPYGVGYDGGTVKREKLVGDENTELYGPCCAMAFKFSRPDAPLYLWHAGVKGIAAAAAAAAAAAGYEIRCEIVWNKNQAQFGALSAQYKQKHEPAYYCFKRGKSARWCGPTNEVTVWDIDRAGVNEFHPTQKPVALVTRAVENHECDVVLDLFGGSGSTLIACEQMGRQCRMIEIDPRYVDVIIKRWENITGKKAKRLK
jgi:site-specific DNA-methyltransferase (adenine-specific)